MRIRMADILTGKWMEGKFMLKTQKYQFVRDVSDVGDIYGDYDRRDYLSQLQTSFVLLVNVNGQRI